MSMDIRNYLGDETLKKAEKTKWWLLARFLDRLIYDGKAQDHRVYVGSEHPPHVKVMGLQDGYIDANKGLRDLMHECERMAVKEVT